MIYDLAIIGAGPAGYLAAERAAHAGMSVLLAEKRNVGGVCLNEGCIPSKTLLYSAKLLDGALHGEKYGIRIAQGGITLDHKVVVDRKNKVVRKLVGGINSQLKKYGVVIAEGQALLLGRTPEGFTIRVGDTSHTARQLLIATGSEPVVPPIPGLREGLERGFVLTNREILDLQEVPENLVIIGGGVIGLEMASYFNTAGSKTVVVEMLDRIAGYTDIEISGILMKNYQKKGVDFRLGCKVVEITEDAVIYEPVAGAAAGTGASGSSGGRIRVPASKVLVSIGRRPVVQGFGLENTGVELEKGRIRTDSRGRTNVAGIYAAGDVNGVSMLAHTAYREAEVCVNNMSGHRDIMRYDAIPSVIYTNPEVAGVGETEESAAQKGIDFTCVKIPMAYSGRYVAENEGGDGICKVVMEKGSGRIIGVHMIANSSSEIIYGAAMMIENEMRVRDIRELVFPHPTIGEAIREALFMPESDIH